MLYQMANSTVDCRKNVVSKSNHSGVGIYYGGGSNGNVWQNDVTGCNWGIGAIWSSSPHFNNTVTESDNRNNRITNCDYGFMVYNNSYPIVSTFEASYGNNSIHSNTVDVSLNMWYSTNSSLNAMAVYWNNGNPSNAVLQIHSGSQLYTNAYISTDPWAGYPLPKINQSSPGYVMQPSISLGEVTDSIMIGIDLRNQKKFGEASDYFLSYLSRHPDEQRAYVELYSCADSATIPKIINFFKALPKQAVKEQSLLLGYLYLKQGNADIAKKINNNIITKNPNTSLSERAMINNVYIALYNENNLEKAVEIFREVLQHPSLST